MRIALFHNLPPGGARRAMFELTRGTHERHSYDLYRLAQDEDGDPVRAAQDPASLCKEVYDYRLGRGIRSVLPGDLGRLGAIPALARVEARMAADIDGRGYDLVVVHHCRVTQSPALLRHVRTPSVYYVQEPRRASFEYAEMRAHRVERGRAGRPSRMIDLAFDRWMGISDVRAARAAGTLLANSIYSTESIARAYGRQARVCYLGTDPDVFSLVEGSREGVVSVGALQSMKGHHLVVEACGRISPHERPSVTIVYEREEARYRAFLEELAASAGVDLRLRRSVTDVELAAMYGAAAVAVGAASLEPFGLSLVEALACGTPVVAVAEGGYREIIDEGSNGVLTERRTEALTQAIKEVLGAPARFTPAALRASVLPRFSWATAADRYDLALQEATR